MASRRKSPSARAREAEHRRRSQAASLGWERRAERERAEFERRSRAATIGWKTRRKGEREARRYERAERASIEQSEGKGPQPRGGGVKFRPTRERVAPKPEVREKGKRGRRPREEQPPRGWVEFEPPANLEERKRKYKKVRDTFDQKKNELYMRVGDRAREIESKKRRGKRSRLSSRDKLERMLVDGLLETGENLDEVVNDVHAENPEWTKRELYTLFFSPEAA